MNEMLIGLVIVQFVVIAYIAGWFIGNKPVIKLKEEIVELNDIVHVQGDRITELQEENHGLDKAIDELKKRNNELNFENESLHNKLNRLPEPKMEKPSDPMEALLLKMIEETDSQDKTHLEQVRKAWNFQPKPSRLIKREEGDS